MDELIARVAQAAGIDPEVARKAIGEILRLNEEIRELIVAREPMRRIREAAQRHGTRFLRDGALDLVRQGRSTLQEINRVTLVG